MKPLSEVSTESRCSESFFFMETSILKHQASALHLVQHFSLVFLNSTWNPGWISADGERTIGLFLASSLICLLNTHQPYFDTNCVTMCQLIFVLSPASSLICSPNSHLKFYPTFTWIFRQSLEGGGCWLTSSSFSRFPPSPTSSLTCLSTAPATSISTHQWGLFLQAANWQRWSIRFLFGLKQFEYVSLSHKDTMIIICEQHIYNMAMILWKLSFEFAKHGREGVVWGIFAQLDYQLGQCGINSSV